MYSHSLADWPITAFAFVAAKDLPCLILHVDNGQNSETVVLLHQGPYSHSLAEWAITACSFFAKDLPCLKAQQKDRKWDPYFVEELRY